MTKGYYKVWQVLQSERKFIIEFLQELQSVTVITKWDVTGCIWINLGSRYTWDIVFKNGPSKIF